MVRSEERLLSSADAFSVCLDDLGAWLTETESVVDQRINLADAEQITTLLTTVKVYAHLLKQSEYSLYRPTSEPLPRVIVMVSYM